MFRKIMICKIRDGIGFWRGGRVLREEGEEGGTNIDKIRVLLKRGA